MQHRGPVDPCILVVRRQRDERLRPLADEGHIPANTFLSAPRWQKPRLSDAIGRQTLPLQPVLETDLKRIATESIRLSSLKISGVTVG
jgi:hypothetical protein